MNRTVFVSEYFVAASIFPAVRNSHPYPHMHFYADVDVVVVLERELSSLCWPNHRGLPRNGILGGVAGVKVKGDVFA